MPVGNTDNHLVAVTDDPSKRWFALLPLLHHPERKKRIRRDSARRIRKPSSSFSSSKDAQDEYYCAALIFFLPVFSPSPSPLAIKDSILVIRQYKICRPRNFPPPSLLLLPSPSPHDPAATHKGRRGERNDDVTQFLQISFPSFLSFPNLRWRRRRRKLQTLLTKTIDRWCDSPLLVHP